jgi:hypothetical protein
MALRFLADHCVSNSTVQTLREANHEVLRLKDVLPVESSESIVYYEGPGNLRHSAVLERRLLPYRQLSTQELRRNCRDADAQPLRNSSSTHRQTDSVSEGAYHDGPLPGEAARRRS